MPADRKDIIDRFAALPATDRHDHIRAAEVRNAAAAPVCGWARSIMPKVKRTFGTRGGRRTMYRIG